MPTFDEGEATGGHTQNPAKMACVQSTTRSGSFSDDMSELDEVKQKQDELIMRLTEHNNALLKNYVSNLESCLCKLQAQLGHAIQSGGMVSLETLQRTLPDERSASMDVPGVQFENGAEHQEIADSEAVESVILKKHAHCTAEICWRQKYTESMGQLQAVLVELKAELEEKTIPECEAENPNTKHQSKVQIIEEVLDDNDLISL
ncbi:hypothetical protein BIW11_01813 [Tropilaelaps mercedesae]|uniref:Uncharacterized protein n=1 Tax=Tropilaelaps mercedesae TaxID=418985 RepID=A0A1V9X895_9ACAR|nr:hypothetical protein BIW11_01813 [Tropilaelaps mercedesae]